MEAQFALQLEAEREKFLKVEPTQPTSVADHSAELEKLAVELLKEKEEKFELQQQKDALLLQMEFLKCERDTTLTLYTNVQQEMQRRKEDAGSEVTLHHQLNNQVREKERQAESLRELHQ